MNKTLLAPFAFIYGIGVSIRNKMYDWGWLKSEEFDIPLISVGNITVGGTGKTPFTELIVENLKQKHKVAVLSRGYKRRTKGFFLAEPNTSFLDIGDEPKQIKSKFPDVVVAVCEKRSEGIKKIRELHPDTDVIILDDAFQHRSIEPWVNIILIDYNRPVYKDHLLPWGTLRDKINQLHRANYVIFTKCPPEMTALDRRIERKSLGLYPYQNLYFSEIEHATATPVFNSEAPMAIDSKTNVIAMSGIGNPLPFRRGLGRNYNVVDELVYPDHHPYRRKDLETISKKLEEHGDKSVIIMTEKDAVKFRNSKKIIPELQCRLFYVPVNIIFHDSTDKEFFNKLEYDIRTNPKHSFLHP